MLQGWLVYNEADAQRNAAYIDWFLEEANALSVALQLVRREELVYGVERGKLILRIRGEETVLPDFCVMRNMDELLSAQLELLGVQVFNNARVAAIANDKARAYQYLAAHGIAMPDTLFVRAGDFRAEHAGHMPFPVVFKSVRGRGGAEVFRLESPQELAERLHRADPNAYFVVQELVQPGRDVRVFVVGGRIVGAILRESDSDFRANHSLGGRSSLYTLTAEELALTERVMELFEIGMAGIDLIYRTDGTILFNEMEDVVGSRTLSLNSDINIVRLYLEHIMASCSPGAST